MASGIRNFTTCSCAKLLTCVPQHAFTSKPAISTKRIEVIFSGRLRKCASSRSLNYAETAALRQLVRAPGHAILPLTAFASTTLLVTDVPFLIS